MKLVHRSDWRGGMSEGSIDCLAVSARRQRHIIGVFIAAFNLKSGDAQFHDLRNVIERAKIAW